MADVSCWRQGFAWYVEGVSRCGYDTGYGIGDADQLGLDELHITTGELNNEIKKLKFLSTKDFSFFI